MGLVNVMTICRYLILVANVIDVNIHQQKKHNFIAFGSLDMYHQNSGSNVLHIWHVVADLWGLKTPLAPHGMTLIVCVCGGGVYIVSMLRSCVTPNSEL